MANSHFVQFTKMTYINSQRSTYKLPSIRLNLTKDYSVLKKLLTISVTFILLTSQVFATSSEGLKQAYDEMNYSLTVEWDQKDNSFYQAQIKKFNQKVKDLQSQGLTNSELLSFAQAQIKDSKVSATLDKVFLMINVNKMTPEVASKYIMDTMKETYLHGASWNGRTVISSVVFVAIFVALAIAMTSQTSNPNDGIDPTCLSIGNCYVFEYECGMDENGPIYCIESNCICNGIE